MELEPDEEDCEGVGLRISEVVRGSLLGDFRVVIQGWWFGV